MRGMCATHLRQIACAAVVARQHNLGMVVSLMSSRMASAHWVSQRMLLVLSSGAGAGQVVAWYTA